MSWWLILTGNFWKKFHAYVKASLLSWNEYCSLEKWFFFRWKSSSFTYKGSPFELNNFFLGKDAFSDKNVPRLLFPLLWRQYLCLWKFYFQMKTFRVYLNRIPFEVIFFFTFSDEAFQGLLWKALSWDEKEIDWKSFIFRWKSSVVTLKGPLTKT